MDIQEITCINDQRVAAYRSLTEAQLKQGNEEIPGGLFIAESPKVIRTALGAGYEPVSLLCERRHIAGDAADIISRIDVPVFTGERDVLTSLTGYKLTRGVLCAMKRKEQPTVTEICHGARRLAVIDAVCDTTNIGAIFRSAAALGIDGVMLTKDSCDPFCRRAVRVSMGSVFLVPWAWVDDPVEDLRREGFATAALALRQDSITLDDPTLKKQERLAMIFGTEGDGLPQDVIDRADYTVIIPMAHGVDSLNVAAASAVTFWELRT
ncbi:MAG: RNA methyltransferase [Clostridium sp.]|nr:RNA methyltransferase [Prevotella sp.]MCM1429106.1 RNA methyltransferase [Clostridium sp.]MCM1475365.1 RNA methyltransferase [Muribaculaceae bacterium]